MPQRHVLLSSMKNEGPFVLEFVAHHHVLGFDEIHIATNDCTDGTDLLLDVLAENAVVTHTRNDVLPRDIPQRKAYQRIREAHDLSAADWLMVLDVDEFLMVNRGNRRVGDLTELAPPEVDLITLSALNYGTSNSPSWKPGRVTRQFTRRLWGKNPNNSPVKSLSRGHGVWGTVYNHHPRNFMGGRAEICYMRGNGEISFAPNDGNPSSHFRHFKPEQITQDIA
ncbi:MAG: glycosyltransferase family 2 protein [Paracoccus sp. (in: a-proteobacteria)]